MRKLIYLTLITLSLLACGNSLPKSDKKIPRSSNNAVSDTSNVRSPTQVTKKISLLDSIDRINQQSVLLAGDDITNAFVSLKNGDSIIRLIADIKKDHRVFCFSKPSVSSKKLLLISIFTNDVEGNPFNCEFGSYYDLSGSNKVSLKYLDTNSNFIKAKLTDGNGSAAITYLERKWVDVRVQRL